MRRTNKGDSEIVALCELRLGCNPTGTKLGVLLFGVVASVSGLSELELLLLAGVELPLAGERLSDTRCRTGLRGAASEGLSASSFSASCSDEMDALSSSPLGYSAHEVCTWYSVMGVRFSRLAERASKQYRQCSTVAMVADCFETESLLAVRFGVGDPGSIEGTWRRRGWRRRCGVGGVVQHGREVGSSRWLK